MDKSAKAAAIAGELPTDPKNAADVAASAAALAAAAVKKEKEAESDPNAKFDDFPGWKKSLLDAVKDAKAKTANLTKANVQTEQLKKAIEALKAQPVQLSSSSGDNDMPYYGILSAIGLKALEMESPDKPLFLRDYAEKVDEQMWEYGVNGTINNKHNQCLGVTKKNKELVIATCNGGREQLWNYEAIGRWEQAGRLRSIGNELCLTAENRGVGLIGWYSKDEAPYPRVTLSRCDKKKCLQLWRVHAMLGPIGMLVQTPPIAKTNPAEAAKKQGKGGRLLCWVMTHNKNHNTKAMAIKNTWGAGCNTLLFMTNEEHDALNTVVLDLGRKESRETLWRKSIKAWMYVYSNYIDQYDWFMRADDDTYVMMDNLREFLDGYNASTPHYFGKRMVVNNVQFYSGGSTNILSYEALRWLGQAAMVAPRQLFRNIDTFADDLEFGASLARIQVSAEDSRDSVGSERFMALNVQSERALKKADDPNFWYFKISYHPRIEGEDCCSRKWVASHYVEPREMLLFEDLHGEGCEAAGKHPWEDVAPEQ
eukprot:m.132659 g.132659  ORF g.132659 m.132659 type:complete len:538 (-) comp16491_c0_seq1:636-2249(-)